MSEQTPSVGRPDRMQPAECSLPRYGTLARWKNSGHQSSVTKAFTRFRMQGESGVSPALAHVAAFCAARYIPTGIRP